MKKTTLFSLIAFSSLFLAFSTPLHAKKDVSDLYIKKTSDMPEGGLRRGDRITYTVVFRNNGPNAASNVNIQDFYSINSNHSDFEYPDNCTFSTRKLVCSFEKLEPGIDYSFQYSARITHGADLGFFMSYISIFGDQIDYDERDNLAKTRVQVLQSENADVFFASAKAKVRPEEIDDVEGTQDDEFLEPEVVFIEDIKETPISAEVLSNSSLNEFMAEIESIDFSNEENRKSLTRFPDFSASDEFEEETGAEEKSLVEANETHESIPKIETEPEFSEPFIGPVRHIRSGPEEWFVFAFSLFLAAGIRWSLWRRERIWGEEVKV